jgi:hypothetical protein
VELYLHFPNTPSWRYAQLKHKDNFTFNFYLHKDAKPNQTHLFIYQTADRKCVGGGVALELLMNITLLMLWL